MSLFTADRFLYRSRCDTSAADEIRANGSLEQADWRLTACGFAENFPDSTENRSHTSRCKRGKRLESHESSHSSQSRAKLKLQEARTQIMT